MIYRHPDGSYHRFPFREDSLLIPIPDRPGWFTDRHGAPVYREPPKPPSTTRKDIMDNVFAMLIVFVVSLGAGWALCSFYKSRGGARPVAFKAATKAIELLSKLQSTSPQDIANAAAEQAREAATLAALKDAVSKLT